MQNLGVQSKASAAIFGVSSPKHHRDQGYREERDVIVLFLKISKPPSLDGLEFQSSRL